jgi:hypothetical protein
LGQGWWRGRWTNGGGVTCGRSGGGEVLGGGSGDGGAAEARRDGEKAGESNREIRKGGVEGEGQLVSGGRRRGRLRPWVGGGGWRWRG